MNSHMESNNAERRASMIFYILPKKSLNCTLNEVGLPQICVVIDVSS